MKVSIIKFVFNLGIQKGAKEGGVFNRNYSTPKIKYLEGQFGKPQETKESLRAGQPNTLKITPKTVFAWAAVISPV